MTLNQASFSFYEVGLNVLSQSSELLEAVAHDFSFFRADTDQTHFEIEVILEAPPYDRLPVMSSSSSTPRNITYCQGTTTYIDYFGKALNIYSSQEQRSKVYTEDPSMAREIVYLTVLSRMTRLLEKRKMHRIHALGLEKHGQGILILLPSGGGKSTLGMSFLRAKNSSVRVISEDSPLINENAELLPFPLRLGVLPHKLPSDIDPKFVREMKRMEFGPKLTIDIHAFEEKLCRKPVPARILLLGSRSTGNECIITPVSKLAAFRHSIMNSVIGFGLYQGIEFIAGNSPFDIFKQSSIVASRFYYNLKMMSGLKTYSVVLGRDLVQNQQVLDDFFEQF